MLPESTLVLETSGHIPSWAHFADGHPTYVARLPQEHRRISQSLIPSLKGSGIKLGQLTQILIGVGPGSFSGIRVAIATAQGLARASGATVIPLRSTAALGIRLPHITFLGIFADARRQSFFFTAYENGRLSRPTAVYPNSDLETMLSKCSLAVTTDGLAGVPQMETPDAESLYRAYRQHGVESSLALEPVYLHPAVTSQYDGSDSGTTGSAS
ncbi:MAG: tRNA (adenosine(37)-N6)-threonylcarbamoyltransferase complex dimerization subunit type 1 TsaB [Verrucomicrobiota bacterium]